MVFYLPSDCGEKLTLSITNLLALVVFQQVISDSMPPNGDEPPILGKVSCALLDVGMNLRIWPLITFLGRIVFARFDK